MLRMNLLTSIAFLLVIVGGINWGLVGAFDFDLVAAIFGEMSAASRLVYMLVGLSALYLIVWRFLPHKHVGASGEVHTSR